MEGSSSHIQLTADDGVQKKILREGAGECPKVNHKVHVHYVGTLLSDGSEFDSSRKRNTPFTFTLGVGQVIRGWDIGVASMRQGELAELTCRAEYAYGKAGSPPTIPANATLMFQVELLSFDRPYQEPSPEQQRDAALLEKEKASIAVSQQPPDWLRAKEHWQAAVNSFTYSSKEENALSKEIRQLKLSCLLNLSLAAFNLKAFGESELFARKALDCDESSKKAYYRLVMAKNAGGFGKEALDLIEEGESKDILDQVTASELRLQSQHAIKQQLEKEKRAFSGLFASK